VISNPARDPLQDITRLQEVDVVLKGGLAKIPAR
jgi:hypothetical protein